MVSVKRYPRFSEPQYYLALPHLAGKGGRGRGGQIQEVFLNDSLIQKDNEMKFFKFNLTPFEVILHIATIPIVLRCCHGNFLFPVSLNGKMNNLASSQIWHMHGSKI